jgi:tetratricopeptide (TPR) repeat protein
MNPVVLSRIFLTAGLLAGTAAPSGRPAAAPVQAQQPAAASAAVQDTLKRAGADLFGRAERLEEDVRELKAILAGDPRSADAHFLLGIAYRRLGSPDLLGEAKAELQQALALNPDYVPARFYLAHIYLDLGRPEQARRELEKGLERAAGQPQFTALLGEAERQLANPQRSVELTRQVLQAQPSFGEARYYLALALFDLKQRDAAIAELEQVIGSGPQTVDPYLSLGTAYIEAGRIDEALRTLIQASHVDPARGDVRLQLARAYRLKGELASAAEQLALAMPGASREGASIYQQDLMDFEVQLEAGLLAQQRGDLDAAAAALKKALDMDPNHGPANLHAAEVFLTQGRYKEAAAHAAAAEKLGFPLPPASRRLLDEALRGTGPGK